MCKHDDAYYYEYYDCFVCRKCLKHFFLEKERVVEPVHADDPCEMHEMQFTEEIDGVSCWICTRCGEVGYQHEDNGAGC